MSEPENEFQTPEDWGNRLVEAIKATRRHQGTKFGLTEPAGGKELNPEALQRRRDREIQIPARVRANITTDHPAVQHYVEAIKQKAPIMVLSGPNRTGKSTLAASIAIALDVRFKWCTCFDILSEIKATFSKSGGNWKIPMIDLLVIDEWEKFVGGEWAETTLDRTVCQRYDNQKPTIIITNKTKDDMRLCLTSSVISRIRTHNSFHTINAPWWKQSE